MAHPRLETFIHVYVQILSIFFVTLVSYFMYFTLYLNINLGCSFRLKYIYSQTAFHFCQLDICGFTYLWSSFRQYITYIYFQQFTLVSLCKVCASVQHLTHACYSTGTSILYGQHNAKFSVFFYELYAPMIPHSKIRDTGNISTCLKAVEREKTTYNSLKQYTHIFIGS